MYNVCVSPVCPADSIEANVENADTHVQNATQQLARAADYQVNLHRTDRMMHRREGKADTINKGLKGEFTPKN